MKNCLLSASLPVTNGLENLDIEHGRPKMRTSFSVPENGENLKGENLMSKTLFSIVDNVNGEVVAAIVSNNGLNAMRKFRMRFMSSGIYEIRKECGKYVMRSSYGSAFTANPKMRISCKDSVMTDGMVMHEYLLHTPETMRNIPREIIEREPAYIAYVTGNERRK